MKLEVDLPENHNGWLIAGKNVMYGNTPVIQISLISGFTYYEEQGKYDASTKTYDPIDCKWFIKFSEDLQWRYKNEETMRLDYAHICILVTGANKKKEYI